MDLLNIYLLVQEFYAIEAIAAMVSVNQGSNFEPMRHSHSRWYRDFHDFRDEYIIRFASAIYDYTVSVVAAELRHCKGQASQYIRITIHRGCQEMRYIRIVLPIKTMIF